MPDEEKPKIIVDDDWKAEAQREKERLAEEVEKKAAASEGGEPKESLFLTLIDMLAQQAAIALGGAQLSNGQTLPPNPEAARHFIDMIAELETKTKGNLTKEESEVLTSLLSRIRWAFSMGVSRSAAASAKGTTGATPPPPKKEKGKG